MVRILPTVAYSRPLFLSLIDLRYTVRWFCPYISFWQNEVTGEITATVNNFYGHIGLLVLPSFLRSNYKIEMVQRRAARWTLSNYDTKASVTDMLTNLGWWSLQQRRVDSRLSLLYKIAHNLTPSCHKDQLRPPRRRSRHMHQQSFLPISCSTTSHRLSFFPRTISQWNNLPHRLFSNCNSQSVLQSYFVTSTHSCKPELIF